MDFCKGAGVDKTAILVHGWNTREEFFDPDKPTASNDHWFPWLMKQLMMRGFKVDAPEMPQYDFTTYELWKREFERFDLHDDTILIGHSCGGGFLVRYLSENAIKVGKVILVAPWLGFGYDGDFKDSSFFAFGMDEKLVEKTDGVTILYSDDDFDIIQRSVERITTSIKGVRQVTLHGKGHCTRTSLGGEAFPELLEEIH